MVHDVADAHVGDGLEFIDERLRCGFRIGDFAIQLANKDSVFAFVQIVTGPEEELVLGGRAASEIDERGLGHRCLGFRKVEGNFTNQSVMVGDDESGFAFIQHFFAGFTGDSGDIRPATHAMQGIGVDGEIVAREFLDPIGVVEKQAGGETED